MTDIITICYSTFHSNMFVFIILAFIFCLHLRYVCAFCHLLDKRILYCITIVIQSTSGYFQFFYNQCSIRKKNLINWNYNWLSLFYYYFDITSYRFWFWIRIRMNIFNMRSKAGIEASLVYGAYRTKRIIETRNSPDEIAKRDLMI